MNNSTFLITGNLADVWKKEIYLAEISVNEGKIASIKRLQAEPTHGYPFILPGFTDSHVHVESSMLIPSEFAKLAVPHGTVSTISDPHEIANVCGLAGVEFMIENGKQVNFKFNFGAPSCVPATIFETAGASLDSEAVKKLLEKEEIKYLSEMMNFPGVLFNDAEVIKKINYAQDLNKPIDGHAPGLRGEAAKQYIEASGTKGSIVISTDHECFTKEEALDKLKYGMKILIREGSAAKNFEALIDLLQDYPNEIMFCSDDKHPDSLAIGHINDVCARAIAKGIPIFNVLQAACVNPVLHYKTNTGLLREGDDADFIVAENLTHFKIKQTYINGQLVAANGKSFIPSVAATPINQFDCNEITTNQLFVQANEYPSINGQIPVIEALEGQLITNKIFYTLPIHQGILMNDVANDILKIVVVNRYHPAPIAKAFIKNFGLKQGAIASSVAHDSHNIVAVGVDDESIACAINLVIKEKGGVSAVSAPLLHLNESARKEMVLGLPVAGLMSTDDGYKVADLYTSIDTMVKAELHSKLISPFMTLSFMALLVIPHLKLSDKGLFDGDTFSLMQ